MKIVDRIKNIFNNSSNQNNGSASIRVSYGSNQPGSMIRGYNLNDQTILSAIYNKIANDISNLDFKHVQLDESERYSDTINDSLNRCLTIEANIDQNSRSFIRDCILTMFKAGVVAVVPTLYSDTIDSKTKELSIDILEIRCGTIIEWGSNKVLVRLFNVEKMDYSEIWCDKSMTAIVENPFYSIMNEPNSIVNRITRKLVLLDQIDEQVGSGKLDLIIQLPYSAKSKLKSEAAEERLNELENQLKDSKYGIGYIDASEKIIQLNRSLDNNLLGQIEYLMKLFYSQLGISQQIMDGTADEQTTLNYTNVIVEPIASILSLEFRRKFITKNNVDAGQSIMFFRDPFKLVPVGKMAEAADKFTRNEIFSSNEIRQGIGAKPSKDPRADELRNKNLNADKDATPVMAPNSTSQNGDANGIEKGEK